MNLQKNLKARRRAQAQRASTPAQVQGARGHEAREVRSSTETKREREAGGRGKGCWSHLIGLASEATRPRPRAARPFFFHVAHARFFFFFFFSFFFSFSLVRALAPSRSLSPLFVTAAKRNGEAQRDREREEGS